MSDIEEIQSRLEAACLLKIEKEIAQKIENMDVEVFIEACLSRVVKKLYDKHTKQAIREMFLNQFKKLLTPPALRIGSEDGILKLLRDYLGDVVRAYLDRQVLDKITNRYVNSLRDNPDITTFLEIMKKLR